ncbi:MAG: hypothetical protein IJS99_05435 [Synergistaceae bacterium]|nr:hypothetical protein [Synergistaceae bacterium]
MKLIIFTCGGFHTVKTFCRYLINIALKFANVIKAVIMKIFALGRIITCQGFHALKNFCKYNKSIIYK